MPPAENPGKVSILAKIHNCRYEVGGTRDNKFFFSDMVMVSNIRSEVFF